MPVQFTPTLQQLIQKAVELGCTLECIAIDDTVSGSVTADPVKYLTREIDGEIFDAILPNIEPHERVVPEKLREIAEDLRLPYVDLYPDDPWS